ncbi:MAG: hypothetical protein F9K49_06220 [Caedimonadaceae bacterium]|nr:MAG: hypothetical protein F9K49_06220 [Caedimonadaceae bacterium]
MAIPKIMISLPNDKSSHVYRFLDYTEANRPSSNKKTQSSSTSDTKPSSELISLSIKKTSTHFYQSLEESCILILKTTEQLETILASLLQNEAPTFSQIQRYVEAFQRFICHILKDRGDNKMNKQEDAIVQERKQDFSESSSDKTLAPLSIKSRAQAYTILEEVATYLERVEPHSPTPYLIHRAIAWGGMSLAEVISDILNNGQDMSLLLDILNVKKEETQIP